MNEFTIGFKSGDIFKVETEKNSMEIHRILNNGVEWIEIGGNIIKVDSIEYIFKN